MNWKKYIYFTKKIHCLDRDNEVGRFDKGQVAPATNVLFTDINVPKLMAEGVIYWCDEHGNKIELEKQEKTSVKEYDVKAENITLEPVLNNEIPKWLKIKKIIKAPTNKQEHELLIKGETEPETETVFEIVEPNQWKCKKCGNIIQSKNEPFECLKDLGGCGKSTTFERITDTINMDLWKIPIWTDIKELDMLEVYDDVLKLIKKCVIFPEEIHYKLFALWIISTWKTGHWSSVGFPVLLGDHDSGKTRALDMIREMGYRMIHSAGTTFPAMVRATHYYHAGLIIDEASDRLNPKTESGRELLNFVKPSYRVGSRYTAADKDDPKGINSYNNFGFKSLAGERNFTASLISRSITIMMQQAEPEIPELYYIQDELDEMQTKLLNYRYKTGPPTDLGIDFVLKGRSREVFGTIISTAMHIGQQYDDIIDYALNIKKEQEEELQDTIQYDLLTIIQRLSQQEGVQSKINFEEDAPEYILQADIFKEMYPDFEDMDKDEKRKKNVKIGYIFKDLHLKKKRLGAGMALILNDEKNEKRLNYLYKKYKIGAI